MPTCSLTETKRRYEGPAGALLEFGSLLSLHETLVGRLFRRREFDICNCRLILDVGSGAGQVLKHIVTYSRPDCRIVAFDLSPRMLCRARSRLGSPRPQFVGGDVAKLPFASGSFDCITCGWVLEHLPNLRLGLRELSRVLRPGGRLLLLATEDTWAGRILSRAWRCRTFKREELRRDCEEFQLPWSRQYWLTTVHRSLGMGGILVEARKMDARAHANPFHSWCLASTAPSRERAGPVPPHSPENQCGCASN